jgi:hemerythrin-like domain-containing protein
MADEKDSYAGAFAAQHRRLDSRFAGLIEALRAGGAPDALRDDFRRLRETLEAHVDQEDRLYYPAVRALRPVHRPVLEELMDAHEIFRSQLGVIEASLAEQAFAEAERALVEFVEGFAAHERAEEALLRRIDAEILEAVRGDPR